MCENTERRILSTPVCLSADTQIFATQVLNWQTHSTHGKMGDTAKPDVKVLNEQTTASKSEIKATDLAKKLQKTMLRWFIFFILCQHWVLGGWVGGVLFLPRNVLYCHGVFSGVFFCLFGFFFLVDQETYVSLIVKQLYKQCWIRSKADLHWIMIN